jgi:hypothetical protein
MFMADGNRFTSAWAAWFAQVLTVAQDTSNSGTTAQRPTTLLYVGKPYFDTTLGYAINLKSTNPTVWVNGAGASV